MNALTIKSHGGLLGQLITDADIIVPPMRYTKSFSVKAIWDTGATGSCITTNVINKLGLIPTGQVMMNTANGTVQ